MLAAQAIGNAGNRARPVALGPVLDGHADKDNAVRAACVAAIQGMGKPEPKDESVLLGRLRHTDSRVRVAVVDLLTVLATRPKVADAIVESLKDESSEVRVQAAQAAGKVGEKMRLIASGPSSRWICRQRQGGSGGLCRRGSGSRESRPGRSESSPEAAGSRRSASPSRRGRATFSAGDDAGGRPFNLASAPEGLEYRVAPCRCDNSGLGDRTSRRLCQRRVGSDV